MTLSQVGHRRHDVDKTGRNDLAQLRTFQDWYLRYQLQSVPGVAEVASVGGFQKQRRVPALSANADSWPE